MLTYKKARFLNEPCGCGVYCGGITFNDHNIGACTYEHEDPATKPTQKNGKKARAPASLFPRFFA